jgi:hypothetical protein
VPSIFNVHRPLIGIVPGFCTALRSNSDWLLFERFIGQCYLSRAVQQRGQIIVDQHRGYQAHDFGEQFLAPSEKADRLSWTSMVAITLMILTRNPSHNSKKRTDYRGQAWWLSRSCSRREMPRTIRKSGQIIVDKNGAYHAHALDEKCLALSKKSGQNIVDK